MMQHIPTQKWKVAQEGQPQPTLVIRVEPILKPHNKLTNKKNSTTPM